MSDVHALETAATPAFAGKADQKRWAERIYNIMVLQGAFFPQNAPIRQTLANLAAFFAAEDKADEAATSKQIDAAIQANAAIFRRTQDEEDVIIATSRVGYYSEPFVDTNHTFAQRLYEPENPLPIDDLDVIITTTRPALTTVEPVYISDYWQQRSPIAPGAGGAALEPVSELPVATPTPVAAPTLVAKAPPVAEPAPVVADEPEPVVTAPALTPAPTRTPPAVEPRAPHSSSTVVTMEQGLTFDLSLAKDEILALAGPAIQDAIKQAIHDDPLRRIVSFGREYYAEDAIASLSKGDLRRIREYIVEQNEPMPDTAILNDVYYKNPREGDYNMFRFSLNYRLNREKDFEFVGVEGARLWSTKGLPTVGTKRLKTSELGQFYAFLEEGYDDSLSTISAEDIRASKQLNRFLTFFEWEYGALPYDDAFKALLPPPLLPEQRTAVLRIESPQHYTFHLAELRYPTANRGGWLHGLEEFFKEHLVPGALITLTATDDPSVFTLQYGETNGSEAKLLQQDDKKGRFAFAKHTFYCDADADLVPSQERLTRLKNMKVLPPGERRRINSAAGYVLEHVGQRRVGETNGFELNLEDLFMAVNVQRPASRAYLRTALAEDQEFQVDGDAFIYFPPEDSQTESREEPDDEE